MTVSKEVLQETPAGLKDFLCNLIKVGGIKLQGSLSNLALFAPIAVALLQESFVTPKFWQECQQSLMLFSGRDQNVCAGIIH